MAVKRINVLSTFLITSCVNMGRILMKGTWKVMLRNSERQVSKRLNIRFSWFYYSCGVGNIHSDTSQVLRACLSDFIDVFKRKPLTS